MYSGLRYLIYPIDDCVTSLRRNNNRMSGGFPHSDIHGSKPIPGSPWLNAGYHVLHRLLLPRHPPNALFALDLIQKEQGSRLGVSLMSNACTFPVTLESATVSVLDLNNIAVMRVSRTSVQAILGKDSNIACISLNDVNCACRSIEQPGLRVWDQTSKH